MNAPGLAQSGVLGLVCGVCAYQVIRERSRLARLRGLSAFRPLDWGRAALLSENSPPRAQDVSSMDLQALLDEFAEGWTRAAEGSRARVAACNQATAEFHALVGLSAQNRLRWRICILLGVAGATALVGTPLLAALSLIGGGVSASLTWRLGRMADSLEQNLRAQWNGLIRRLKRSFPVE